MSCYLVSAVVVGNLALLCLYEAREELHNNRKAKAAVSGITGMALLFLAAYLISIPLRRH